jgi:glycosyltransferase involved in cell wall biosynthesis
LEKVLVPKKILIVTECFYPEEFKINDVALSWKDKGYDVDVLTLTPTYPLGKVFPGYKNGFFQKDEYHGVKIFRVYAVTGYRDSFIKKLLRFINFMIVGSIVSIFIGKRYDYIFGFNTGALTSMLPAVMLRKLYKKPLMFWVQDIWPDSLYAYGLKKTKLISYILDIFVKFIHKDITSIAISGKGFESKLRPYVDKNLKFNYLPNWADDLDMSLSPAHLSKKSVVHFTFAGNIGKQQNLENIINAFCMLPNNYQKKSQLNIVGDGPKLDDLRMLTDNNPHIVFYGKQMRKDMVKFYKASDFLIVSLVDEPVFSITVPAKTQTYIAAKKPILAIINGDTVDIVKNHNLGLHAHPSNVNEITRLFIKCIEMNDNERDKFIIENDYLLSTIFNKEIIIDKLLLILTRKQA